LVGTSMINIAICSRFGKVISSRSFLAHSITFAMVHLRKPCLEDLLVNGLGVS
jgi:hypothetical protein